MEKIDFSKVEMRSYIDSEGFYPVTIRSYSTGTSEFKGTPFIKFTCVADDGASIDTSFYLTEKSLWRYKKFMTILGFEVNSLLDPEDLAKTAVGKRFIATVKRKAPSIDPATGEEIESKYFEVTDFARESDRNSSEEVPF